MITHTRNISFFFSADLREPDLLPKRGLRGALPPLASSRRGGRELGGVDLGDAPADGTRSGDRHLGQPRRPPQLDGGRGHEGRIPAVQLLPRAQRGHRQRLQRQAMLAG